MSEICPLCNKKLKTISALRRHLTIIHNIKHENHRKYNKIIEEKEGEKEKQKKLDDLLPKSSYKYCWSAKRGCSILGDFDFEVEKKFSLVKKNFYEEERKEIKREIEKEVIEEYKERIEKIMEKLENTDLLPLDFSPKCEADVVFLFSRFYHYLGFDRVLSLSSNTSPDCYAIRDGKEVGIEFEYKSSNFNHPLDICEIVICWNEDKKLPMETIEFSSLLRSLNLVK